MPLAAADTMKDRRRELGAYYTPEPIVRFMLQSCLSGPLLSRRDDLRDPLRILDPACGDGAFLIGALDELRLRNPSVTASDLITRHLCGVDIDPLAVSQVRDRLQVAIEREGVLEHQSTAPSFTRVLLGDALSGPDFDAATDEISLSTDGINWRAAFPAVAAASGFDLVIGNPPYVREKDAKPLFDRLATTELGRRHRQPRMDLWHYFLHRGLDLLRPGGILCFIVNSYWTSAVSARPLIDRLAAETTVRQLVLFGDSPLFKGITGRHMILQVQRGRSDEDCHILDLTHCSDCLKKLSRLADVNAADQDETKRIVETHRPQSSLFDRRRLLFMVPRTMGDVETSIRLGDRFAVRQGIAENPPFVTRKMVGEFPDRLTIGSGVFVLTRQEVDRLGLSQEERALLRPYFVTRSIGRFDRPPKPTHWILYLTPRTSPAVTSLPAIARHLDPVRPILERRREVQRGTIHWWHLHWPREERLFREPRILAVQMGRRPRFVYAESPTYVGFSVNIVQTTESSPLSLPALTALLNSHWAQNWFDSNAKHRGVALDISGTVLRDFPIPIVSDTVAAQLEDLCLRRQSAPENEHPAIEDEIERHLA